MLTRSEPALDLGVAQVRVALDKGPRVIEESGYFLVRHSFSAQSLQRTSACSKTSSVA